ncbi:MAG: PspA/IM30 family protein [Chitinispirillaceae bacterium]
MRSKDGVASRVGRIITGSARKVVEVLESAQPEIVMEEAIHEIDSAIADVRGELGKSEAERHLSTRRLDEAQHTHDELLTQIRIALDEKREDLAEAAVQRQLDIETQIPIMKKSITEAQEHIAELESYIAALQAKKRQMRDELREWRTSREIADKISIGTGKESPAAIDAKVSRAEAVFERMMSRSHAALFDGTGACKLAELEELSRKNRIRERLSQIRTQHGRAAS